MEECRNIYITGFMILKVNKGNRSVLSALSAMVAVREAVCKHEVVCPRNLDSHDFVFLENNHTKNRKGERG